jgi:hypothetical protein
MAIRTYSAVQTVSRIVEIPRTCSDCGQSWMGRVTVEATHATESSLDGPSVAAVAEARERALEKLEAAAREK